MRIQWSRAHWRAIAALLAVAGVSAFTVAIILGNVTTTENFGPAGHFTRSVSHQVYPMRVEALWILGGASLLLSLAIASVGRFRRSRWFTPAT